MKMKVKANRTCSILGHTYTEGEEVEVSESMGEFLVMKEGFEEVT